MVDNSTGDSIFKLCLPQTISKNEDKIDLPLLFSSPEVISKGVCSTKNDIWGVGILLYILIYGSFPFPVEKPQSILQEIKKGVDLTEDSEKEDSKFFKSKNKNAAPSLLCKQFLSSMLSKDPQKRFGSNLLLNSEWIKSSTKLAFIKYSNVLSQLEQTISLINNCSGYIAKATVQIEEEMTRTRMRKTQSDFKIQKPKSPYSSIFIFSLSNSGYKDLFSSLLKNDKQGKINYFSSDNFSPLFKTSVIGSYKYTGVELSNTPKLINEMSQSRELLFSSRSNNSNNNNDPNKNENVTRPESLRKTMRVIDSLEEFHYRPYYFNKEMFVVFSSIKESVTENGGVSKPLKKILQMFCITKMFEEKPLLLALTFNSEQSDLFSTFSKYLNTFKENIKDILKEKFCLIEIINTDNPEPTWSKSLELIKKRITTPLPSSSDLVNNENLTSFCSDSKIASTDLSRVLSSQNLRKLLFKQNSLSFSK